MNDCFCHVNGYEVKDAKARPLPNVDELKLKKHLKVGDVIRTAGYYSPSDGGHATYLIRKKLETDIDNGGKIHFVQDNLVAELIPDTDVNAKQYGAMGDGVEDVTEKLQAMLDDFNIVTIPNGKYMITRCLDLKSEQVLTLVNAQVVLSNSDVRIPVLNVSNRENVLILGKNATVKNTLVTEAQVGIKVEFSKLVRINGLNITEVGHGIELQDSHKVMITDNILYLDNDLGVATETIVKDELSSDLVIEDNVGYKTIDPDEDLTLNPDYPED